MTASKSRIIRTARADRRSRRPRAAWMAARRPDDVLAEQVRRLAVCTAVGAGLWTYGLVMDTIVRPLTVGVVVPRTTVTIEIAAIAASGLMFLYVRYARHVPGVKTDAALLYLVANAIGVALLNSWTKVPAIDAVHLSWNTVVILVSSMIMPDDAAEDAGRVARGGVDGSARRLDRAPARHAGAVRHQHVRPVHAELRVRRRGDAAFARAAPSRPPAPPGAGDGQLPPGRAARPRRHGRGVAREAPPAGAQRGDQARSAGAARRGQRGRGAEHAAPVRARSAGHRGVELAAHDSRVRLRRHRPTAPSTT